MLSSLTQVDAVLAQRVADGFGMLLPAPPIGHKDVPYTAKPEMDEKLSLANNLNNSIKGRKIAILAANMVDGKVLELACTTLESEGACVKIIAPILGDITSIEGKLIVVDHSLPIVSSTQFDAVLLRAAWSLSKLYVPIHLRFYLLKKPINMVNRLAQQMIACC